MTDDSFSPPVHPPTDPVSAADSSELLEIGQVLLGKYRIERKLGAGGMGEVFLATHLTVGTKVALKLPLGRKTSANITARLVREARASADLDPERVARVFDLEILEDGTPVIVLEYLEGQTLADYVASRGRLSLAEALYFTREAALALAEAHERGIVHRDIKPANLFVEERPGKAVRLRVLDFGVASFRAEALQQQSSDALTSSETPLGSLPYMAPEQLRDAKMAEPASDVWALGITLFELCTGERPFLGKGSALTMSIAVDQPPLVSSKEVVAPALLDAIVARCLEKDPRKRPQSARELVALLDGVTYGAPPIALMASEKALGSPKKKQLISPSRIGIGIIVLASVTVLGFIARGRARGAPATSAQESQVQAAVAPRNFTPYQEGSTSPVEGNWEIDDFDSASILASLTRPLPGRQAWSPIGSPQGFNSADISTVIILSVASDHCNAWLNYYWYADPALAAKVRDTNRNAIHNQHAVIADDHHVIFAMVLGDSAVAAKSCSDDILERLAKKPH